MFVKALLKNCSKDVITASPSSTIDQAIALLIDHNIGCLPITDESGKLCGIVTSKDIFRGMRKAKGNYQRLTLAELMSTEPVVGLLDDDLGYISSLMYRNHISHVPIFDGIKMVGLVSKTDIVRNEAKDAKFENRYLNLYMDSMYRRDMSGDI